MSGKTKIVFHEDDYNTPELLDSDELDRDIKFLKELSSKVNKCLTLQDKELRKRLIDN